MAQDPPATRGPAKGSPGREADGGEQGSPDRAAEAGGTPARLACKLGKEATRVGGRGAAMAQVPLTAVGPRLRAPGGSGTCWP